MGRKLKIWFDVDGVLADFTTAYLHVAREVTGRNIAFNDVKTFEFAESIVSQDENRAIWGQIHATPGLVLGLAEHDEWLGLARKLRAEGHFVGALTSPAIGPYWIPERVEWLEARGFVKRDIVFASNKGHVAGDVLIDDKPENLDEWGWDNVQGLTFLVKRPWNAQKPSRGSLLGYWGHANQRYVHQQIRSYFDL